MYSVQRSISTNQISSLYNRQPFDYNQSNAKYPNLQRSNSVIVSKRGFKPSDRFDPAKKEFLLQLSKKIWQRVRSTISNFNFFLFYSLYSIQWLRNIYDLNSNKESFIFKHSVFRENWHRIDVHLQRLYTINFWNSVFHCNFRLFFRIFPRKPFFNIHCHVMNQ